MADTNAAGLTAYDLRFSEPPGTTALVFGGSEGAPAVEVTLAVELPPLEMVLRALPNAEASFTVTLPELESDLLVLPSALTQLQVVLPELEGDVRVAPIEFPVIEWALPEMESSWEALYDPRVARPTTTSATIKHQQASMVSSLRTTTMQTTLRKMVGAPNRWQAGQRALVSLENLLPGNLVGIYRPSRGYHQQARPISYWSADGWHQLDHTLKEYVQGHKEAIRLTEGVFSRYQDLSHTRKWADRLHHQEADFLETARWLQFHVGKPVVDWVDTAYQDAVKPPGGLSGWVKPKPPPPPPCYTPRPNLLFSGEGATDGSLYYVCERVTPTDPETPPGPPALVTIPIKKAYIVMNEVRLFKVDGNVELPVISLSLDVDMDSWAWGFSVTLPAEALSYVSSTGLNAPVELEAVVNGESYLLLAESVTRNRSFGRTTIQVSGRGQSAYLSSPYSPVMNFANTQQRTAQQLIADALTTNGVSIGWEVEWGITDWVVPGNVWSQRGTYIDAVNSIVGAAGAHVLPHPSLKKLQILPRYPVLPWNWATTVPNIELPSDLVETEAIKWIEKPAYNGVYVSGTSNGVLGYVKRTGTAGDYLAEMVTDSLITHADVARQRGQTILADTGRMAMLSLSLPVLPETGIIKPGKMVKYMDAGTPIVGLVKGVSVSMSQQPVLRQTIEVEAHV